MEPEVSSEEKLLKLIRKKNASAGPKKVFDRKKNEKPVSSIAGKANFDAAKFINGMLLLIVLAVGMYIVWHGAQSGLNKNDLILEEVAAVPEVETETPVEAKPLSYYEEIVAQRDIFNTSFQKTAPTTGPQTTTQTVQPVNPLQNVTLVGVVMDDEPQAIIHNQNTNETFFLKKGESTDGVVVENIVEEKVTVQFQGESIDLTL